MKTGTKSLLFGVHQFIIHPIFVYIAWVKLYKTLPNWKETICIIIHDWGYWGLEKMDDKKGEEHPKLAAMKALKYLDKGNIHLAVRNYSEFKKQKYYELCLYHSRFYAKLCNAKPSKLCWADKLGTTLMPSWLWVNMASLSGELQEYMTDTKYELYDDNRTCPYQFFTDYCALITSYFN